VANVNIIKKKELEMDAAKNLFETLANFKANDSSGLTSQQLLINYCKQVLGSTENLHYDYKEKDDSSNSQLSDSDKKNLAKAVSGFSNSSGGVLIWGILNKTLVPKPIGDIEQFLANLLHLAPQSCDPLVSGIDGVWLPSENKNGEGFAIIYIPESVLPPHRVVIKVNEVKNHYYTRSGDSFVIATRTQLEDMFGRRPKPVLILSKRFSAQKNNTKNELGQLNILIGIRNAGRGSAEAPLLALKIMHPYRIHDNGIDGNGRFGLPPLISATDTHEKSFGASTDVIHSGIVRDVAKVIVKIPNTNENSKNPLSNLTIDYKIAAKGIQLICGQDLTTSDMLFDKFEYELSHQINII
jgi:hypothetical protein